MKLVICMFRTIKLTGENTKKMEVLFLDKLKFELILKIQFSLTLSMFCLIMIKKIHRLKNLYLGRQKLQNDVTVSRYTVNQRAFQQKSQFCFNLHRNTNKRAYILSIFKTKLRHSTLISLTQKYQNNIKYRQIRC